MSTNEKTKWRRDRLGNWVWERGTGLGVLRHGSLTGGWTCQISILDGVAVFTGAHDTPDAARDAMRGLLHPDSPLIPDAVWDGLAAQIEPSPWVRATYGWRADVAVDGRIWTARVNVDFEWADLVAPVHPSWRIVVDGGLPELRAGIAGCEAAPPEVHAMLAHDIPQGES